MRELERLEAPGERSLVRVTYEFLRPVPIGELEIHAELVRPGRRVSLLEASLSADGTEVARARALAVRPAKVASAGAVDQQPPGPDEGRPDEFRSPYRPMFFPDAIEIRFVEGGFGSGPCTAWLRLRVPIVAGEDPSPLQRVAAAADFGNGLSTPLSWDEYLFVNPDLTLYVQRPPAGDWVCLRARTRLQNGTGAISESELFDERGRIGHATQALFVAPR